MDKITVFLPCRKGSERVINKNTREFAGIKGGLVAIKLNQLLNSKRVDSIVVSTNDSEVIEIAEEFNSAQIKIDRRCDSLSSSNTSTDELINYVPHVIDSGNILWTHVTSPFIDEHIYDDAIDTFFSNITGFDSLMSVNKIQKFIWSDSGPINYDRKVEKWPRTQTLNPVYEINSGFFIAHVDIYKKQGDRIGSNPYLYILDELNSFDIDWEHDFKIAEMIWNNEKSEAGN